jgi:hypothetical protein
MKNKTFERFALITPVIIKIAKRTSVKVKVESSLRATAVSFRFIQKCNVRYYESMSNPGKLSLLFWKQQIIFTLELYSDLVELKKTNTIDSSSPSDI